MKRICLVLTMILIGITTHAQRHCDLEIYGGVIGDTIIVDPSGQHPVYFDLYIRNNGPDTIHADEVVHLISPFLSNGAHLILNSFEIEPGVEIEAFDTLYFKTSPAAGNYRLCDTVWLVGNGINPVVDPDLTNNANCRNYTVLHNTTSVSEASGGNGHLSTGILRMKPNPATDIVTLDFVAENSTEVRAIVSDLSGRTVLNIDYGKAATGQHSYNLDISSLTPGVYFVTLNQSDHRYTGRLVKQ